MSAAEPELPQPTVRSLVLLSIPAVVIGVVSGLALWAVDELAALIERGVWTSLPAALGVDPSSGWWIAIVLTVTGLAVGLAVQLLPGHAGPDSATTELVSTPLRVGVLPSLAVATVLGLAGGVSLGPENPIIAINASLLAALVGRLWKAVPTRLVVLMAASGTIGALFGTPVAAALVFTGIVAAVRGGGALWDKLFVPLVSAAAGSLTMTALAHPSFAIPMPAYTHVTGWDVLSALIIGSVATGIGLLAALVFPAVHRTFHAVRFPVLMTLAGGLALGLLGAIGGPITLFKGLSQMSQLVQNRADYTVPALLLIVVVKLIALLVAAGSGFRGGRVFPAVFIGAAVGTLASALVPAVPVPVAVAAGVMGMTLAVTRDGWIAIFIGVAVTQNLLILPILCLAVLPTWLMVTKAPVFLISPAALKPTSPRGAGGAAR
ncbi:ion channel protein [Leifsonia sp. AG29]|uniref:ion channel protein n=1 Tax=Leifsonia sp. AG29 TaxID=2598860 RepID=UPI00131CD474|nr:ion channel protein [Leifsonia sp. AG29]